VNEVFARRYWPNQNPIGKRLRLKDNAGKEVQVIGMAKLSRYVWISENALDFLYLPLAQNPQDQMALVAQAKNSSSAALLPVLRECVQRLDRNMPVFDVRTMESMYEMRAITLTRLITRTVGAMGLMGLILAVIGLYGVVSYSVNKRSREFGIRMAVGAGRQTILRMVLRQGLTLGMAGLVVGLAIGIFACRAMTASSMFAFRIGVLPFVAVSLLLLAAVALSAYTPARRASLVDQMRALRDE